MVQFKVIISDTKTGKSEVKEVKDTEAQLLVGRKLGEVFDGAPMGLQGRLIITGGSDKAGFPMRADVSGGGKNYVLMTGGVGFRSRTSGAKKRRLVRGNTVTEEIFQLNAKKYEEPEKTS
jgi:small subunit ribosomal protein S6e